MFTYDVATLIELIENKPCLWDKISYKGKIEKSKAWSEILLIWKAIFTKWIEINNTT